MDIEDKIATAVLVVIASIMLSQLYVYMLEAAANFIRSDTDSDAFVFIILASTLVTMIVIVLALLSCIGKDSIR